MLGNPILDVLLVLGIIITFVGVLQWNRNPDRYSRTREGAYRNIRAMFTALGGLTLWDTAVLLSDTSLFGKVAVIVSWLALLTILIWVSRRAIRSLAERERTAADIGTPLDEL